MIDGTDLWQVLQQDRTWSLTIFWSVVFIGIPLTVFMCRLYRPAMDLVFAVMIISICHPNILGISFLGEPQYRAAVRGFDVFFVDLCAVVLALAMLWRWQQYKLRWLLPLTLPYFCYMLLGLLSWSMIKGSLEIPDIRVFPDFTSTPPDIEAFHVQIYPLYELFRVARGFFIFWVVANYVRDRHTLGVFVSSIVLSAAYLVFVGIYERYGIGIYRVSADLMHSNDFGVYLGMLGAILLPLAFEEKKTYFAMVYGLLSVALLGVVVMTVSRSALVAYLFAVTASLMFAWWSFRSVRNATFVSLGILGVLIVLTVSYDTLAHRFYHESSVSGSMSERQLFNKQAVMMAQDRFLGAGLGNYSAWSWEKYADEVGEVVEPGVPAHNIWFLTLGELGWLGVLVFLAIWIRTYQIAWRSWSSSTHSLTTAIVFGITLAMVSLLSQSLVHHSYRNSAVYNLLQVFVGVLVAIYYMNQDEERLRKVRQV